MDILDGIASIRRTFIAANLKPPTTILLKSHDEGLRFLSAVRCAPESIVVAVVGSSSFGQPIEMADGSMWMEAEVMGIKVRWPANTIAMPDGSWSYT